MCHSNPAWFHYKLLSIRAPTGKCCRACFPSVLTAIAFGDGKTVDRRRGTGFLLFLPVNHDLPPDGRELAAATARHARLPNFILVALTPPEATFRAKRGYCCPRFLVQRLLRKVM